MEKIFRFFVLYVIFVPATLFFASVLGSIVGLFYFMKEGHSGGMKALNMVLEDAFEQIGIWQRILL